MTVHVVRAADPALRSQALEQLVDALLGGDDRSLALEDLAVPTRGDADNSAEGRAAIVAAVVNAASSPPFMTARRVVVVRNPDDLTADDAGPLLRYLADPLDTTALVLVPGGGRLTAGLTKSLEAASAETVGAGSERTDDVLQEQLRSSGLHLRPDARRAVTTRLGEDAGRVAALVEVLSSTFGSDATLDVDDVEPYLGEAGSVPVYMLANAIDAGDVGAALETLHRLLTVTSPRQPKPLHPLQVMGLLHNHYRRLARLDDPDVVDERAAMAALGGRVKPYPARKALEQSRALGSNGIREAFARLHQADLDLKGARAIPEDVVMEVLVARLAGLSARSGRRPATQGGRSRGGGAARSTRSTRR
jgi:DNA polymerase-3 subunit delta